MTLRRAGSLCLLLLVAGWGPWVGEARTQVPPDSVPPDSTVTDSTTVPDSVPQVPDSVQQLPDSVAPEDSLPPVHNLPELPRPAPEGFHTGVWEWDRDDLLATRALTLGELVAQVPGVVGLFAGDYGKPRGVSAFGLGGGRIRIFWEGMELPPLEGGVADLSRIGLGGVSHVRVERRGGILRIELRSLENVDPRPYSLVEVGTGDLDTNLFRGTFIHPRALGGSLGGSLDRIDTRGPRSRESGSSTGGWLRYALYRGDRGGLAVEARRMTADRDTFFEPAEVTRTDLAVRGRVELAPDLVVGGFYGSSSLSGARESEDDTARIEINQESRSQLGLRVGLEKSRFWVEGGYTSQRGEGWPSSTARFGGGLRWERLGAAQAVAEWEEWSGEDEGFTTYHLRGWTAPLWGFSVFGEYEDGARGVPYPPPIPDTASGDGTEASATGSGGPSLLRVTDRRFARYGALFDRWGFSLGAARLEMDVDSLALLGLASDREGLWVPGGIHKGFEISVRAPLGLGPLRLGGQYQDWDPDPEGRWRYVPDRIWQAGFSFHDVYYESEQLEVFFDVGVQGRDPMPVPFEREAPGAGEDGEGEEGDPVAGATTGSEAISGLQESGHYLSWYAWLEIRVQTVRVFLRWENVTNKDENVDFPGTRLPGTRAMYGVRWTLWN